MTKPTERLGWMKGRISQKASSMDVLQNLGRVGGLTFTIDYISRFWYCTSTLGFLCMYLGFLCMDLGFLLHVLGIPFACALLEYGHGSMIGLDFRSIDALGSTNSPNPSRSPQLNGGMSRADYYHHGVMMCQPTNPCLVKWKILGFWMVDEIDEMKASFGGCKSMK